MSESTLFQFPADLPFAAWVNPKIANMQRLPIQSTYNGILQSYPSDQLAGQITPGCSTLPYNQTTECQSLILAWAEELTMTGSRQGQLPDNIEELIMQNPGPDPAAASANRWNGGYEFWGVVPGVAAGVVMVDTVEVGTGRAVRVIVP